MNNLKEINFKNCSYCYFHGIIKVEDFDFDNILLDEKSYENILIDDIIFRNPPPPHPFFWEGGGWGGGGGVHTM